MSKTEPVECKAINSKKAQLAVLKLIKRIYKAFEQKNYPQVKKLQKTLVRSWSFQLLRQKKLPQKRLKTQSLKAIANYQYVLKIVLPPEHSLRQNILTMLLDVPFLKLKQLFVVKLGQEIGIFSQVIAVLKPYEQILKDWLNIWGITINYSRISSTYSFDLAGFSWRQFLVGDKVRTQIKAKAANILSHYRQLANCCDQLKGAKQIELISQLNLIIQKWRRDYLSWCCQKLLKKLDYLIAKKLRQWAMRRHPRKGKQWVINKYWFSVNGDQRRFCVGEIFLLKHCEKHFCAKVDPNTIHRGAV